MARAKAWARLLIAELSGKRGVDRETDVEGLAGDRVDVAGEGR